MRSWSLVTCFVESSEMKTTPRKTPSATDRTTDEPAAGILSEGKIELGAWTDIEKVLYIVCAKT